MSARVASAVERIEVLEPDVVLLGLQRSTTSVDGAIRLLPGRHPDACVIVFAAHPANYSAAAAAEVGAVAYPPDIGEPAKLVHAVRNVAGSGTQWPK